MYWFANWYWSKGIEAFSSSDLIVETMDKKWARSHQIGVKWTQLTSSSPNSCISIVYNLVRLAPAENNSVKSREWKKVDEEQKAQERSGKWKWSSWTWDGKPFCVGLLTTHRHLFAPMTVYAQLLSSLKVLLTVLSWLCSQFSVIIKSFWILRYRLFFPHHYIRSIFRAVWYCGTIYLCHT